MYNCNYFLYINRVLPSKKYLYNSLHLHCKGFTYVFNTIQ